MENIQLKELLQSVAGIEDKEERDNTFRVVKGILTDKSIGEEYVRMSEDEEYRDGKISEGSDILRSVLETFEKLEERKREDTMWRIQTTISSLKVDEYKQSLLDHNIKFISYETSWSEYKVVDIFSSTKEESNTIKEIILEYDAKYTISSNTKYL